MLPESESQEGAEGGLEMEVETGEVDALVSDLFTCAEERPSPVKPPIKVDVSINGQSVQMELDTGAAVSVCTYRRFKELWPDGDRLLQPSSRLLRTFSGEKLSVRAMGTLLEKYSELFKDDLGCARDVELNIPVDPAVKPIFYKPRTVPLAYREKVDAELERQIKEAAGDLPEPGETLHLVEMMDASPVTAAVVRLVTERDATLSRVLQYTRDGWPEDKSGESPELSAYRMKQAFRGGQRRPLLVPGGQEAVLCADWARGAGVPMTVRAALLLAALLVAALGAEGTPGRWRRHGWPALRPEQLSGRRHSQTHGSVRRSLALSDGSWRPGQGAVPRLRHGHDLRRRWERQRARRRGRAEAAVVSEWPAHASETPPPFRISDTLTEILTESEEQYLRALTSHQELAAAGDGAGSTSPNPPQRTASPTPGQQDPELGIVTKFLQLVESQQRLGENCTAGTDFQLEGVVDRYGQERFRYQAELTVKMANLLTRLWKFSPDVMDNENLLKALVLSLTEADDDIFAAGNCYDQKQYKDYHLFCPFAYRLPEGPILLKDLAVEYDYLSNTSEWYFTARKRAAKLIRETAGRPELGKRIN
ncbi:hypothetical protein FJT64_004629 [Amphibalanus amphitrite]|uniref:Peptidase A2 domain-containing protein n=1 Tax=Amphibalanus amphitrite TaxID=1232801 RepID=A0A6A4W2R8_AMPAM|nr:hypothetical protein FJT64_004629 [Amphibalanus amphitrite]